ncbi:MAG: NAD-dependent dehydratase [Propionibacteriaceae bacterium]|nr:NAD-dependent dehydratase [Propionibacteriaceae bacterium]
MRVAIAGGHGKIALQLERLLSEAGHEAVGIIRNPDQAADLLVVGGIPLVIDLERTDVETVATDLVGVDAVVFAAGAGPGSGAERKWSVDRDAAILMADAAEHAGVRRYVLISARRADDYDPNSDEVFQIYLRAKSEADADLRERDLDWTIVRPGGLTDDPPTGKVTVADDTGDGTIPRADVAALVVETLVERLAIRRQFEVISGDQPIAEALRQLG